MHRVILMVLLIMLQPTLSGCGEKAAGNKTETAEQVAMVKELTREEKETKRKAETGDAGAQYELGMMYYEKDYAKAVEWWQKAAEQGYAAAQGALGTMYVNGLGVPKDIANAVELMKKAATQGDSDAQYNLANMYYKGEGVSKDMVRAYAWHYLACKQLTASTYENRCKWLEAEITPSDRTEGQRLASNWKKGDAL